MNSDASDNGRLAPSFSRARRFSLSLNTLVAVAAVVALVSMVNYLAARHFFRWNWAEGAQGPLSPLTQRVLKATTNEVKVTVYFDSTEPLYPMCVSLLKEYANVNNRVVLDLVDYVRNPGAAQIIKARYKLNDRTDRDLVIFDSRGQPVKVYGSQLSEYDMQPLINMQSQEVKRTHFKGELLFTSALLKVITPRALKAYFLDGHGEHNPEGNDKIFGYSQFCEVLAENNLKWEKLRLEGAGDVPTDCNLLIIAGPRQALAPEVTDKIDRYLKQGGRMLALFNNGGLLRPSGVERVLATWGVIVGRDVVYDDKNSLNNEDVVVSRFGAHSLGKPFVGTGLYLVRPRSITKARTSGADLPQVDLLATTGPEGRVVTDIRADGRSYRTPNDLVGEIPLMAAIEKGSLRNVSADRGSTRVVVVGDSYFLGNETIDNAANRQFATHAINWLMARDDLLVAIPPKPIKEYKVTLTKSQLAAAHWILLAALPGSVLVLGWFVWLRRRR